MLVVKLDRVDILVGGVVSRSGVAWFTLCQGVWWHESKANCICNTVWPSVLRNCTSKKLPPAQNRFVCYHHQHGCTKGQSGDCVSILKLLWRWWNDMILCVTLMMILMMSSKDWFVLDASLNMLQWLRTSWDINNQWSNKRSSVNIWVSGHTWLLTCYDGVRMIRNQTVHNNISDQAVCTVVPHYYECWAGDQTWL